MTRTRRWSLTALGALALAAGALSPWGQQWCVRVGLAYAARRLHLPIRVDSVEPSLFQRTLVLHDITVGDLVHADELEIAWNWTPLLAGQMHLSSARTTGVVVNLAAPWPETKGGEPPPLQIDRLEVTSLKAVGLPRDSGWIEVQRFTGGFAAGLPRGELTGIAHLQSPSFLNPLAPAALTLRVGEGARSPWSLALHSADVDIAGSGQFSARPWRLEGRCDGSAPLELLTLGARGRVSWTSEIALDTRGLNARWNATAPEIRAAKLTAHDFSARGETDLKKWTLAEARLTLAGGAVQLSGDGQYDPPQARFTAVGRAFNLAGFLPALPAAVALRWDGQLHLQLDAESLRLDGTGRAELQHRGATLMSGPLNLTTAAGAPLLRAELTGPGGALRAEPGGGRYQLSGNLTGPGLEMIHALSQGSLPLRMQLQAASFSGEADPHVPEFSGTLSGSGTVQSQPATLKSRLRVTAREWQAEELELTLGGGGFKGRAGGALGFTWPALPAAPFKFAPAPKRAEAKPGAPPDAPQRRAQAARRPAAVRRVARRVVRRVRFVSRSPRRLRSPARRAGGLLRVAYRRAPARPPARRARPATAPASHAGVRLEGRLDNVPLAALLPDEFSNWEISGRVSGDINWHGDSLEADLRLAGGRVHGVDLPDLHITAAGSQGRWIFHATDASGNYDVSGVGPRDYALRGRLPLDLAALLPPAQRPDGLALAGDAEILLESRPDGNPAIAGEFTVPELGLAGKKLGPAVFALSGRLKTPEVMLRLEQFGAVAQTRLDLQAGRYTGLAQLFAAPFSVKAMGKPLSASLTGTFNLAGETAAPLAGFAGGWLDEADIQWRTQRLHSRAALLMPDRDFSELPLRVRSSLASADGRLGIDRERGISLTLATTGRAALIAGLIDDLYLDGQASGDLRLRFPWKGPVRLAGQWQAIDASFGWSDFPVALSAGSGAARLEDKHLYLEDLRFTTEGGSGRGTARLDFGEHAVDSAQVTMHADSTRLAFIPGLLASADADLKLDYGWESGWTVGGEATILNGRLQPPGIELAGSLTPVQSGAGRRPIGLDLQINTSGGLDIVSPLYRMSVQGGMHLTGATGDPHAAGRFEGLPGGRLRFRDRQYAITRVTVDFTGQSLAQGALDLEAESTVRGYRILLDATGALQNPHIEFHSDPSLDLQNIVTLLLTGKTQDELTAQGIVPSNELIAIYLANQAITVGEDAGLNRYIEYLALTPALDANRGIVAPSLTLGRNFGDRFSSLVRLDLGGANYSAEGEYSLSRKLRLSLSKNSIIGGIGGDLRFFSPFDFDKALGGTPAAPAPPLGKLTVTGLPPGDPLLALPGKNLQPGKPAERRDILKAGEALRRALRRRGNLIARITTRETVNAGRLDLLIEVAPGPVIHLAVTERGAPRRDLEKKLARLDLDVPFLSEFTARAKQALDAALAEAGRTGRAITVSQTGEDPLLITFAIQPEPELTLEGVGRGDWPRAPAGAPDARPYFPSLRFGLRFSPRPHLHNRYNALILAEEKARYLTALSSAGYFSARLDIEPEIRGTRVKLRFSLDPGPRARTERIEFTGDASPVPAGKLPVREGQPLTGAALEESRSLILNEYFRGGYRAATATWKTRIEPDGRAVVSFTLHPGVASVTGPVALTGLKHTRASVVRSRLRFKSGAPLDPRELDESRTALYRSGVFDHVAILAPVPPADSAAPVTEPVAVEVGERPRFEIGASLGYDSEERVRESLQIGDLNFLGRAHYLSLTLKHSALEQRIDLSYRDPDLFGLNLDMTGTARYQFQHTDSFDLYRRGVDVRLARTLNRRLSLQLIAALTRVTFGEIRVDPTFQQLRQFSVPSLGGALIYNSRDEALNPHRGDLLSVSAQYAAPLFGGGETRFTKLNLTAFHYRPLGSGIWAQGLRLGEIINQSSTPVPISERFYAGGDGSIRGFRRDKLGPLDPLTGNPVGGLGQLLLNEEVRFPLGVQRKVNFSLFMDAGNVDMSGLTLSGLRPSYGAGFFYLSPLGPLRFEYGRPFSTNPGEPSGVFHFAIGRAF